MLEKHADRAHLKTQMRLARVIRLGIKEPFADGVSPDRVAGDALPKALVALLGKHREVKMSFEVGRLVFKILQFFLQGKMQELIGIFKKGTPEQKAKAADILSELDVINSSRYKQELR